MVPPIETPLTYKDADGTECKGIFVRPATRNIVPVGELDPDQIHVPSVYVKRVVQSVDLNKWIERRTVRKKS